MHEKLDFPHERECDITLHPVDFEEYVGELRETLRSVTAEITQSMSVQATNRAPRAPATMPVNPVPHPSSIMLTFLRFRWSKGEGTSD